MENENKEPNQAQQTQPSKKPNKIIDFLENNHIVIFLTYVAFAFSIWHVTEIIKLSKSTENTSETLSNLISTFPTKPIGIFPKNLESINKFLSEPIRDSLLILTDALGYGQYSNPEEWDKYRGNLEKIATTPVIEEGKTKHVAVILLIHNTTIRDTIRKEHIFNKTWKELEGDSLFQTYRKHWAKKLGSTEKFDNRVFDVESLRSFLKEKTEEFKKEMENSGIQIFDIAERQRLFVWIALNGDNSSAVFSFAINKPIRKESSFSTNDKVLINYFKEYWREMKTDAQQ